VEGVLVDKILFLFAICRCVPEIFTIKVESWQKALWILEVFSPSQILGGRPSKSYSHFITPVSRHVPWKKFCGDTPTSLEVIGAHTLNFKPNFKFSRLNFFRGSPFAVVVCASKSWSICKSCKNLRGSTPQGPKYSLPKNVRLGGSIWAPITLLFVDQRPYTCFRLVPKSTTLDDPELTLSR